MRSPKILQSSSSETQLGVESLINQGSDNSPSEADEEESSDFF